MSTTQHKTDVNRTEVDEIRKTAGMYKSGDVNRPEADEIRKTAGLYYTDLLRYVNDLKIQIDGLEWLTTQDGITIKILTGYMKNAKKKSSEWLDKYSILKEPKQSDNDNIDPIKNFIDLIIRDSTNSEGEDTINGFVQQVNAISQSITRIKSISVIQLQNWKYTNVNQ